MNDFCYIFQTNHRNNNLFKMMNIKLQMTKTPRIRVDLGRVMAYSKGNCVTTTLNDLNSHFSRKK